MSQTYTFEFQTVDPQVFLKLKQELSKYAKITTDPNGDLEISSHGIEAEARYDSSNQTLTVDLLDRPWFVTVSDFRRQLEAALLKCKG
jgi:hypothetical protein